ncbi:hypothetical protein GCM10009739_14460 [Microbacterium ulmi]
MPRGDGDDGAAEAVARDLDDEIAGCRDPRHRLPVALAPPGGEHVGAVTIVHGMPPNPQRYRRDRSTRSSDPPVTGPRWTYRGMRPRA